MKHLKGFDYINESSNNKVKEKSDWLLKLYKNDTEYAIKHAQDCLDHVDIDNEPKEMKEFWEEVIKSLKGESTNEGKNRYDINGNHVIAGGVNMPQFWSTSADYKDIDDVKDQKQGLTPEDLISPVGNDYTYITDPDDHIDSKKVRKLVEPHVKKFNDFGFNPSEKTKKK